MSGQSPIPPPPTTPLARQSRPLTTTTAMEGQEGHESTPLAETPTSPSTAPRWQRSALMCPNLIDSAPDGSSTCGNVDCPYFHSFDQMKATLIKTKFCRHWRATGRCPYGDKCLFYHGRTEMRRIKHADAEKLRGLLDHTKFPPQSPTRHPADRQGVDDDTSAGSPMPISVIPQIGRPHRVAPSSWHSPSSARSSWRPNSRTAWHPHTPRTSGPFGASSVASTPSGPSGLTNMSYSASPDSYMGSFTPSGYTVSSSSTPSTPSSANCFSSLQLSPRPDTSRVSHFASSSTLPYAAQQHVDMPSNCHYIITPHLHPIQPSCSPPNFPLLHTSTQSGIPPPPPFATSTEAFPHTLPPTPWNECDGLTIPSSSPPSFPHASPFIAPTIHVPTMVAPAPTGLTLDSPSDQTGSDPSVSLVDSPTSATHFDRCNELSTHICSTYLKNVAMRQIYED